MDWKVLCIDVTDPLAEKLNDVNDIRYHLPGILHATFSWFRTYKIPDGKAENMFAFCEEVMDKEYALEIIDECHFAWKQLVSGRIKSKLDVRCTTLPAKDLTPAEQLSPQDAEKWLTEYAASLKSVEVDHEDHTETSHFIPEISESSTEKVTIKRHAVALQRKVPHGSNELSLLISALGTAGKCIAGSLRSATVVEGPTALVELAEKQIYSTLAYSGLCCIICSSRQQKPYSIPAGAPIGNLVVCYSPLLGATGGATSMGTTFSIYNRKSPRGQHGDTSDILKRSAFEQIGAGYILYSSCCLLVYTMGYGVHSFLLDQSDGHFYLLKEHLRIPALPRLITCHMHASSESCHMLHDVSTSPNPNAHVEPAHLTFSGSFSSPNLAVVNNPAASSPSSSTTSTSSPQAQTQSLTQTQAQTHTQGQTPQNYSTQQQQLFGTSQPRPVYSFNMNLIAKSHADLYEFVSHIEDTGHWAFRYDANLVSNFHRVLMNGGIMGMPGPTKPFLPHFLAEAAPLALLLNQAGGKASVGRRTVVDMTAWAVYIRVTLYVGNEKVVYAIERKVHESKH
eukprot:TRINITY_DN8397_c0_g1::TRINITY_DN8397_c0_g1_i1::g.29085::m.29085 TRINITY_DN8397_c0_g1::TRINITY_DN8397_c0_g1_i1::g.29085  ORF type:complete len:637 (+),score=107.32,sp/P83777/IPYR_CANAL/60.95/5e-65,Pyrophosphatase/PF00719.14/1.6e-41,FBPase/PF00316.15/3.1e-22,FBPase/PF00316.15/2e-14,Pex14_N/PF04695.8/1.8 TRINITY_DN8397_c0_g1_i1:218-1912(+)